METKTIRTWFHLGAHVAVMADVAPTTTLRERFSLVRGAGIGLGDVLEKILFYDARSSEWYEIGPESTIADVCFSADTTTPAIKYITRHKGKEVKSSSDTAISPLDLLTIKPRADVQAQSQPAQQHTYASALRRSHFVLPQPLFLPTRHFSHRKVDLQIDVPEKAGRIPRLFRKETPRSREYKVYSSTKPRRIWLPQIRRDAPRTGKLHIAALPLVVS